MVKSHYMPIFQKIIAGCSSSVLLVIPIVSPFPQNNMFPKCIVGEITRRRVAGHR